MSRGIACQLGETLKLLIPFCPVHAQGQRLLCFCQRVLSLEMVWKGQFGANEMAGRRELHNSSGKWCSGLIATLGLGSVPHL